MKATRRHGVVFGVFGVVVLACCAVGLAFYKWQAVSPKPESSQIAQQGYKPSVYCAPQAAMYPTLRDDPDVGRVDFEGGSDRDTTAFLAKESIKMFTKDFYHQHQSGPLFKNIFLVSADIRQCPVDAISNAANETCVGGGGVDGAIHDAINIKLSNGTTKSFKQHIIERLAVSEGLARCPTGTARAIFIPPDRVGANGAEPLHAKIKVVLQAAGPTSGHEPREKYIRMLYSNILDQCKKYGIRHVAIPGISSGIYGGADGHSIPGWVLGTIRDWFAANPASTLKVVLAARGDQLAIYKTLLAEGFTAGWPTTTSQDIIK